MTTKLQHSINPFSIPPHYTSFAQNYPSLGTNQLHQQHEPCFVPSMDRILESRNVDSMRKMMVMQEQVFKQQVHELHRLYNLQKKLMDEIENESKRRRDVDSGDPKESTTPSSVHRFEDEETPDVEVDLTLSIGHSTTKQKSKSSLHKCSTHFDSDQSNEGSSSGRREERVGISACQDNTRPRWLMQDLRLNRR